MIERDDRDRVRESDKRREDERERETDRMIKLIKKNIQTLRRRQNKNNRNRIGSKIRCNSYSREDEENDNGGLVHAGGNAI